MKRSEMLKEIYYIISDNYTDGVVLDKSKDSAEEILTKLEEKGMLPPLPKHTRSVETIYGESEAGRAIVSKYLSEGRKGLNLGLWDGVRNKRKINPFKWEEEDEAE